MRTNLKRSQKEKQLHEKRIKRVHYINCMEKAKKKSSSRFVTFELLTLLLCLMVSKIEPREREEKHFSWHRILLKSIQRLQFG